MEEMKHADPKKVWVAMAFKGIISWAIWTVLAVFIAMFVHKPEVPEEDKSAKADPEYDMENGHFGCLEDLEGCVCSCCCPAVKWAYTMSHAGLMNYWGAFMLLSVLLLLNTLTYGRAYWGLFVWIPLLAYRQQLRKKLEMPFCDLRTIVLDCLYSFFCPCCLIAQEARAVKSAHLSGHEGVVP